jgi:hypothetical protein
MAVIYEGRCSACDASTLTADGYLAVSVDEPASAHAHPNDPYLVILAHPCESLILEEIGYTYKAAALGGRLVGVTNVFCRACGQPFEIRHQTAGLAAFGCGGCLAMMAVAAGAGVGVSLLVDDWIGYVAGWATSALFGIAAESAVVRFVRWRHADRAVRVATPKMCPSCGSREYSRPGALWGAIPCVACGQRAVRFRAVGKS